MYKSSPQGLTYNKVDTDSTYILVRNDFDVLDVSSGFEDLSKHIFRNSWIQTSNIQCALIWLWSSTSNKASCTIRGHHPILSHGRAYSGRDRIGVLRNNDGREGWRGHVRALSIVPIFVAWCASGRLRRWWELIARWGRAVIRHYARGMR